MTDFEKRINDIFGQANKDFQEMTQQDHADNYIANREEDLFDMEERPSAETLETPPNLGTHGENKQGMRGASFSGELLSHTDDPETSKIAAKNHKLRAGSHAQKIFEFVKKYPDSTAGELGEMTGLGQHETARRLSDLFRKGYIVKGEPKRCNIKNTLMTAWRKA